MGGASGDAGTEYKRAVIAYAVTHGLTGTPLPVPGMARDSRLVSAVATETTHAVDDVRIDFESGRVAHLQAKRTLNAGKPFKDAVEQWVKAARDGLDPGSERLVIVSGQISESLIRLGLLLERRRTDRPAALTKDEQKEADRLNALLGALTDEQREAVWQSAAIWELKVEEPHQSDAHNAFIQLRAFVADNSAVHASQAWKTLLSHAGLAARQRTGYKLAGWHAALESASIPLSPTPGSSVAAAVTRQKAINAYWEHLRREGSQIDLRALGADLPPLPLEDANSKVRVRVDPGNPYARGGLLWAFLRRHRVTLTGLPGGGKSTAIRQLAAQLTRDESLPFPVVASLRGLDPDSPLVGFREQIIGAATKDLPGWCGTEIRAEIGDRLRNGAPVALLLDALDETYERRHSVVAALQQIVENLGEAPAVLLATRHTAYAQAATLGWSDLELMPPSNVASIVERVVSHAADNRTSAEPLPPEWVAERVDWASRALASSPELKETPLLPTFLALLACKRAMPILPRTRGAILVAIVSDFVLRRELVSRRAGQVDADTNLHMGTRAFIAEAAAIMEAQGAATLENVISAVSNDLARHWDLAPGASRDAATRAVRYLDEAGVFIHAPDTDVIVPRIALLSEIGAAMFATQDPVSLPVWVSRRVEAGQYESISLACQISHAAMAACEQHLEANPGNAALATALIRAAHDANDMTEGQLRLVCRALISEICTGTAPGWRSFETLVQLPVPTDLIERLLCSMERLPEEYQSIIRSEVQHNLRYDDKSFVAGEEDFRATLGLTQLPPLPGATPDPEDFLSLRVNLFTPKMHAAESLLEADISVASELADIAIGRTSNRATRKALRALLAHYGHADEAAQIDAYEFERLGARDYSGMLTDIDDEHPYAFYSVFSEWEPTALSAKQRISTGELASFMQFTGFDAYSMGSLVRLERDYVLAVIRHTAAALALDVGVLAAQAAVTLQRMRTFEDIGPSDALAHPTERPLKPNWARVDDPAGAVQAYIGTLHRGLDHAAFAAYMLAEGPASFVTMPLQKAVRNLASSPRHQHIALEALATKTPKADLRTWLADANPVVREVAAGLSSLPVESRRDLLSDADREVRVAALLKLLSDKGPGLAELLDDVLRAEPVGWMCRRCATVNGPYNTSCIDRTCPASAPDLQRTASTARRAIA